MSGEFGIWSKRGIASFQIILMISSLFAFSYLIFSAGIASGGDGTDNQNSENSPPKSKHFLSSKLGLTAGGIPDALVTGVQWAGTAYIAGRMVGSLFGMSKKNTKALSTSLRNCRKEKA